MKYSPLGNNNLEAFLQQEDVEIEIPGLMDFVIYTCDNTCYRYKIIWNEKRRFHNNQDCQKLPGKYEKYPDRSGKISALLSGSFQL